MKLNGINSIITESYHINIILTLEEGGDQYPLVLLSSAILEQLLECDNKLNASLTAGVLNFSALSNDEDYVIKTKEACIAECCNIMVASCSVDNEDLTILDRDRAILKSLLYNLRYCLGSFVKAKAAKIVTESLVKFIRIDNNIVSLDDKVSIVETYINWAKSEKRVFLRQALDARLMALHVDNEDYVKALEIGTALLRELKKLDDKSLLMEIQLLESRAYYNLRNVAKSRAALTSARTTANAIYCPAKLQASLDLQSGILHAEEKDFKTGFSYFYEAFEGYDSIGERKGATKALKYMLLSKIMMGIASEVDSLLSSKLTLNYLTEDILATKQVAKSSTDRSLAKFKETLSYYGSYLEADFIVKSHLEVLYEDLLEKNLCKIIEPFSVVEISHVANLINLPIDLVEQKLSKMILDKTFHGILDQGNGNLIVFDESEADKTYASSLDTITQMEGVVNSLYTKAKRLT